MTPAREETEYGPIGKAGIAPLLEPVVGHVAPKSPAAIAGIQPGDRIVAMNGHPVRQFTDIDNVLSPQSKPGQARQVTYTGPLVTDIVRGTSKVHVTIPASNDPQDPYRGIYPPTVVRKLSLIPAVGDSIQQNWRMLKYAAVAVGRIFRAEGSVKELSGPVSIARISGEMFRAGMLKFIALVAMISLQLGVMNLLPIPVLDGGHIFILLIEGLVRRDLSVVVKERIHLDKENKDILRYEITTIDKALTKPWVVMKTFHRERNVLWYEENCGENNNHVVVGKDFYFLSADGYLMPTRKDQPPPDPKYFSVKK